jgi:hypothetical protein
MDTNAVDTKAMVNVINTRQTEGTVYYIIRYICDGKSSLCSKRYSQFETLQEQIVSMSSRGLPPGTELPPKKFKLFTSHTAAAFIEERRVLLENFLRHLVANADIRNLNVFSTFMTSDLVQEDESIQKAEADLKQAPANMPEDVEITGISIPQTRTMSDHVLYQIDLENNKKRQSFSRWAVLKRFGQIYDMDAAVRADFASNMRVLAAMPELPRRQAKLFTAHLDQAFIEARRVLLENYLVRMLRIPEVVQNKNFLVFLGIDE